MSRRSSITATFGSEMFESISTNMDSVITVSDNIEIIKQLMDMTGFEDLLADVRETLDFTNIVVESGAEANWDAVNKVLTVPTVKGGKGDDLTMTSVADNGDDTFTWTFSDGTMFTTPDLRGHRGIQGEKGDSLTLDNVEHIGDSVFRWSFSDGTVFTTPRLRGHKGDKGDTGLRGPQGERGISVHHMKGTSTTDPHGDFGTFGERDTYTFYGDADEKHVLGWFTIMNGLSSVEEFETAGVMARKRYDTNDSGVVDDSEALGGKTLAELEQERDDLLDLKLDKAGGTIENDLTVQGNLYVNGTETIVNTETLVVKDNEIIINAGEPGNGITKGTAGIRADRGTEPDYLIQFDETDDSFKIGEESNLQKVATREDTPLDTGVAVWDSTSSKFDTTRDLSIDSLNTSGQVNNRDMVVDGEKLDGVEEGATADQTAEEIEFLYESSRDTNKYTDLEKQFVDVATTLDTVATTLPTAINEVHLEVDSIVDGTTDIAFDNAGTRIAAVTLEDAVKEIDSKVGVAELLSTVVATVIDSVNEVHTELDLVEGRVTTAEDTLSTHISSDGSDHAFINQDVTTTASPTFANVNTEGLVDGRDVSVDGAKLDTIESGAQVNVPTNLSYTAATRVIASSTGEDATLPQVTALADGLMIASDKDKLDGIEANAKDDQTASEVPVTPAGSLIADNVQTALEDLHTATGTLAEAVEKSTAVTGTSTLVRYDKLLGNLDVIQMVYTDGDLTTVRYFGDNNTDSFYRDVLVYSSGNFTSIKHYYDKPDLSTESAATALVYDVDNNLISTQYTEL